MKILLHRRIVVEMEGKSKSKSKKKKQRPALVNKDGCRSRKLRHRYSPRRKRRRHRSHLESRPIPLHLSAQFNLPINPALFHFTPSIPPCSLQFPLSFPFLIVAHFHELPEFALCCTRHVGAMIMLL